MKIKTSELIGPQLDWAVCVAEGDILAAKCLQHLAHSRYMPKVSPSTDWAQGGPIIKRQQMTVSVALGLADSWRAWMWVAGGLKVRESVGPTPLIAAMRCFCRTYFGDEVDIPEALV
jgi:hypothetical protein